MTYKEIVERIENILKSASEMAEATKMYPKSLFEGIYPEILEFINRQQEQLEAAIAGQETLQKALADKDKEAAELNSDLKLLKNNYNHLKTNFDETIEKNKRLRDKVVGLTAEKDQLIKTFGECQAEAVKDFVKAVIDGINEGYILHSSDIVDFTTDYLRGKMAGDTE